MYIENMTSSSILMMGQGVDDMSANADFFALLSQHAHTLLRLAAALVGPDDAEDAVQEAVLRAWRAWSSLRDPTAASAWLLRITGNVCRDWRRGRLGGGQHVHLPLNSEVDERGVNAIYGGGEPAASLSDEPGGSDHAAALDVRRAINSLSDDLRTAIILRYYVEMDATEIGAALNTPPATIRTRLRRALIQLRKGLTSSNALPEHPETPPGPDKIDSSNTRTHSSSHPHDAGQPRDPQ